jgi:hypothetical protein
MELEVNARLVLLVYEALLKSFWRKQTLKKFLRNTGISEHIISSWGEGESKRDFLDRLFLALSKNQKGKLIVLKWAYELSEQRTFPDLRNWEDSDIKIQQANKAIIELRYYINQKLDDLKLEKEKKKTKENVEKINQEVKKSLIDRECLQKALCDLLPLVGTQQGGYDFEKWFYEALDYSDIQSRRPYKVDGRQIDGSLTLDGTTYLVELKFTKNQVGSESIDSFKAKVDKMADNTMGIFVSMQGYSSQAIKEASGRRTTLLLLEASHLFTFLQGIESLSDIIRRSRRHVSQTSEALFTSGYIK